MHGISAARWQTAYGLTILDALILIASGVLAAWVRFTPAFFEREMAEFAAHPGFIVYAILVQWGLATTFDLYRAESWRSREILIVRIAALALTLPVAFALGVYFVPAWRFGRGLLILTLIISLTAQALARALWLLAAKRPPARNAVIIGDGPIIGALLKELERRPSPPFRIIRHFPSPKKSHTKKPRSRVLAKADLIIVASLSHNPTVEQLASLNFRGTPVVDAAAAYAALTGRIPVLQVDSRWFIATGDFSSLANSPFHHIQRILDIIIATVLLVVTLPISILSAIAIAVCSGFPVFYRQERLGRFGEPFTLFKFRTLKREPVANGSAFVEEGDDRVLIAGRFMRRWRIDELPQLINVLRGEMSIAGPRPERPKIAEALEREIPFYAFRYSVRPGITGWAQVHLPYCSETADHLIKLEFDLYSLRHHGPAMYAMVLLRTAGALIFQPGR